MTGSVDGVGGRLSVCDDGPGMSPAALAGLGRGVRWDESRPGTGFGLAIARDVAEAAGARLAFGLSADGGLAVEVVWTSG